MPTRQKFDHELVDLRLKILDLGRIVNEQIGLAVTSMVNQDLELANAIVVKDLEINDLQADIEEQCILLIATQQPIARDLRKLVAGFKVSMYLERMGDLSVDIAKITIRIGREELIKPLIDLPRMSTLVQEMITVGLKAYVDEDCGAAAEMALMDDKIDKIYAGVFGELKAIMMEAPHKVTQANYLLFASRFLERLGDYCTNIAEEIIFICNGKRMDLNE
ncbi:phosphate transport system regulatory protein PhoU [Desulfosporosinus orientis DSM 765]|uniref:Phosphate-specific transport system accessory protein PhoU n=1 Tax=Desulfosporosinus orientis (strain ATCC 19365 / DSM 765 / NCIMB 8382 / VKM B-1628 / Singapore I) TaxID=768706 RepID=G7W988_DESOD|nr:phosphate signaling complex protein PhoU [Desulfosporosinus orientis]AET68729.1 phosphate transport system regulatory protein PhoU [Desulfosporosinus orientis DSM 765]